MTSDSRKTALTKLLDLVVTAEEMAAIDRTTIDKIGIPGMVLMENAGRKVTKVATQMLGEVREKRVDIVCGKGNNGGDGYVIARYLSNSGALVRVLLTAEPSEIKGDAGRNLAILGQLGIPIETQAVEKSGDQFGDADLIIDALLGTGVTGPLKQPLSQLVESMNAASAPILSVDLPTGMVANTGAVPGACIHACNTVTIGHLKRGLLFSPGRECAGKIHVADIGFPTRVSSESGVRCFRATEGYVGSILPKRPLDTFKNRRGQVLLLAGSVGMTGAAALAAEAVLRAGAGLAMLGVPQSLNPIVEQKLTEVMTLPLAETEQHSLSFAAIDQLSERLEWADVLAVGPGITTHADSTKLVSWLLENYKKPLVLDADALNCLTKDIGLLKQRTGNCVITPHPGELSRLLKTPVKDILDDSIEAARRAANDLDVVVVLKGGPTVTASPQGEIVVNSTGNPGMATAGTGDVLTGVIAGLAAQGMNLFEAAVAGVYLHGLSGDICRKLDGEPGLLAGDILNNLPLALQHFEATGESKISFC